MAGEDGRGQGTALYPQVGDQRQRHGKGAPAKAGKVIDDRYFFLVVVGHRDSSTEDLIRNVEFFRQAGGLQSGGNQIKQNDTHHTLRGKTGNLGGTGDDGTVKNGTGNKIP